MANIETRIITSGAKRMHGAQQGEAGQAAVRVVRTYSRFATGA
jgi:hypothetical protein